MHAYGEKLNTFLMLASSAPDEVPHWFMSEDPSEEDRYFAWKIYYARMICTLTHNLNKLPL